LIQDCPCDEGGGVNLQGKLFQRIRLIENRVAKHDLDEFLYCFTVFVCPGKGCSLFQKVGEGLGNMGEPWDKWALVAQYSQCQPYLLQGVKLSGPVSQAFYLKGVDVDSFFANDHF